MIMRFGIVFFFFTLFKNAPLFQFNFLIFLSTNLGVLWTLNVWISDTDFKTICRRRRLLWPLKPHAIYRKVKRSRRKEKHFNTKSLGFSSKACRSNTSGNWASLWQKKRKEVGSICAFLGARIMQAKSEARRGLKAINEKRLPLNCWFM